MSRKELFGLVGYPLGHSFSESFFNNKFNSEGIDAQYLNFEIPNINEFRNIINTNTNLRGLNVTIPYKEQVISYLDDIDITASEIGAVNVVKFIRNGNNLILKGFNSDVIGFCNSLKPLLKPHHTHALVLGTGGAAKAIAHGLKSLGVEPIYVSRSKKDGVLTYNELTPEIIEKYQVIVNTTPAGMYPHVDTCPDIPYHLLTPQHLCYDVVYNPEVTLFMKKSQEQGAMVKNGLEMLILQALAAWEIWNS